MKLGRTIVVEINIEGPRWQADFNEELRHLLNHIDSSVHMWDAEGWQDKLLLGTDRRPTGLMRLHHGYVIGALPEDDEPPPPPSSDTRTPGSAAAEPVMPTLGKRRKAALVPPVKPPAKASAPSVRMVTPDAVAALPKGTPSRSITADKQGRLPLPKPKRRKAT